MKEFMVEVTLPDKAIALSYALAVDRSRLWSLVLAETMDEVNALLESLPLHHFFTSFSVTPLAFNLNPVNREVFFSLN